jgi:hypothetical protein
VIAAPFELPGVNETVASPSPSVAVTDVGGAGIPDGVTADEAVELLEFPWSFVATAENV